MRLKMFVYLLSFLQQHHSNPNKSITSYSQLHIVVIQASYAHPADFTSIWPTDQNTMAPTRSKKRKSTESTNSADVQNFPAPPQLVPTKQESSVKTPVRSPSKKVSMGITLGQKQALIDNLQLESKDILPT